jgi:hypothetical protein
MIAPLEALQQAISTSSDTAVLDDLARLIWRGLSEGEINEDDAQGLSEQIAARRPQRVQIDGSLDGFARSIMGSIRPFSALETGSKPRRNVCTNLSISERARSFAPYGFHADRHDHAGDALSYCVKEKEEKRAQPTIREDRNRGIILSENADRRHKPIKSKRGPKGSTYLTWDQVKDIDAFAHIARSAGKPLNRMVTIRAPIEVSDADGKKAIRQIVAHIQQDFKRAGCLLIGVTVYEKAQYLHAHVLLHVPPGKSKLIGKRCEGEGGTVHVRPADEKGVEYVTKQRKRLPPDYEKQIKRRWIKSERIEGPRYTYTTAAKALLARHHAPPPSIEIEMQAAPAATTVQEKPILLTVPSSPTTNVVQFPLFDDLPQQRLVSPQELQSFREEHEISQADIATVLRISDRSHVANFERGHDAFSLPRQRILRNFMDTYQPRRLAA